MKTVTEPRQAVLTALAGVTACDLGLGYEVMEMGAEDPGLSFAAACALVQKMAAEVERLGGDPAAVLDRVRRAAEGLAPPPAAS